MHSIVLEALCGARRMWPDECLPGAHSLVGEGLRTGTTQKPSGLLGVVLQVQCLEPKCMERGQNKLDRKKGEESRIPTELLAKWPLKLVCSFSIR